MILTSKIEGGEKQILALEEIQGIWVGATSVASTEE